MSTGNGSQIAASQYAKAINSKPPPPISIGKSRNSKSVGIRKEKKVGWFRKKFNSWVRRAWEEAHNDVYPTESTKIHDGINGKTSVRFTIYPASGGYVIEHAKYFNRYQDGEGPELTIVNTGDNLGTTIEHILTMEALKS